MDSNIIIYATDPKYDGLRAFIDQQNAVVMCIKKTLKYEERDENKRAEYLLEIESIDFKDIVYIDESGIDHNMIKEHCWIKRGSELIGERSGKARGRTSVIAALNDNNINAPMTYQGTMNTALFLGWLEKFLVPSLSKHQTVVMDNAAIHKNIKIKEMIEAADCHLLYLPTYSPDFNPIENYWAVMKKNIRKICHKYEDITTAINITLKNEKKWFYC